MCDTLTLFRAVEATIAELATYNVELPDDIAASWATAQEKFLAAGQPRDNRGRWTDTGGGGDAKAFASRSDADQYGGSQSSLNPSVSAKEKKSLIDYKTGLHHDIQEDLRHGKGKDKRISDIDAAISRSKTTEDVKVFRGMDEQNIGKESLKGSVIKDKGFVSTSLAKDTGEKYTRWADENEGGTGVFVEMRLPKGTPALWMEPFWTTSGESELLLPRNSSFLVVDDFVREDGRRVIIAEYQQ